MRKQRELLIAKEAIQSVFLPFRCSVECIENGNRVQVRVFGEKEDLMLTVEGWTQRVCDAKRGFPTIVGTARTRLERRGFHLWPRDSRFFAHLGDEDASPTVFPRNMQWQTIEAGKAKDKWE